MTIRTTHVVPHPKGGWDVKQDGARRASRHFSSKDEAVNWARKSSRDRGSEFLIHGLDGRIQEKDSHGGDESPPEG